MNTEVKNARYWLFATNDYEALGGLEDLVAISNNIDELLNDIDELRLFIKHKKYRFDYYTVVDTETWTTIWGLNRYDIDKAWKPINRPIKIFHNI